MANSTSIDFIALLVCFFCLFVVVVVLTSTECNRQAKETRQAEDLLKRCLALNPTHHEALQLFQRLQQPPNSDSDQHPTARDQVAAPSASYWLRSNRIRRQRWNETARN